MNETKVPTHVVIIPDGNRRWAKEKGFAAIMGHEKSTRLENISVILDRAAALGIKYFSIWGFSTENWKRSSYEKKYLFKLILEVADNFIDYAEKNKVRFRHIGRKDRLPRDVVAKLNELENLTDKHEKL